MLNAKSTLAKYAAGAGSLLLVTVSAGAFAQGASSPAWEQVVEAAKKEGAVVWYGSGSPEAQQSAAEGFKKAYGITATYSIMPSGTLEQRLTAEMKAGRPEVDVVATAGTEFAARMAKDGNLVNLDDLPVAKTFPKQFWNSYYPTTAFLVANVLYNTNTVKPEDVPKTWQDLTKPRWKNRIAMASTAAGLTTLTVYHGIYKKYGEGFIKGLGENKPREVASPTSASSLLTSGEVDLMFPSYGFAYHALKDKGAPVGEAYLDINIGYVKLLYAPKNAKNKNAALLFINWSLTPEGQQAWNGKFQGGSPLGNAIPTTLTFPADATVGNQEAVAPEVPAFMKLLDKYGIQ